MNLEPIYAAFFALLAAAPNWTDPYSGNATGFSLISRVPRDLTQLVGGQLPALFQEELGFEIVPAVQDFQARSTYKLRVDVAVVLPCFGAKQVPGTETNIPSQGLNLAITSVLTAITPASPNAKQTLGGLVNSVVCSGRVERVNGLPGAGSQLSVGVIPFTILTM